MTAYIHKPIALLVLLFLTLNVLAQTDARKIMELVEDRDDGYSSTSILTMVLIDKKGKKRTSPRPTRPRRPSRREA